MQVAAKELRTNSWRLVLSVLACMSFIYIGQDIARMYYPIMWPYEPLRLLLLFFGALYLWALLDLVHGLLKVWLERKLMLARAKLPRLDPTQIKIESVPETAERQPGIMNVCIEDSLAMVPEQARYQVILAWVLLGTEYAAREKGRAWATELLASMITHVQTAKPVPDWRE